MTLEQSLDSDRKFVFVLGPHRSGTTILWQTIALHPDVSRFKDSGAPWDEGEHLQSVYRSAKYTGGVGKFAFYKSSYLDDQSTLLSNESKTRLLEEWGGYWDLDKKVLMEKSPGNTTKVLFLQKLFINAYFIAALRHPFAIAIATQRWVKLPVDILVENALLCYEYLLNNKERITNLLPIYSEHFCSNPQQSVRETLEFLEERDVELDVSTVASDPNAKYAEQIESLLSKDCSQSRKLRSFGERLLNLGYSVEGLMPFQSMKETVASYQNVVVPRSLRRRSELQLSFTLWKLQNFIPSRSRLVVSKWNSWWDSASTARSASSSWRA